MFCYIHPHVKKTRILKNNLYRSKILQTMEVMLKGVLFVMFIKFYDRSLTAISTFCCPKRVSYLFETINTLYQLNSVAVGKVA